MSHSPPNGDEIFRNCTSTPRPKGLAARCSQPLSTNQTPHPTTKDGATTMPPHPQVRNNGLVVSKPNSVSGSFLTGDFPRRLDVCRAPEPHPLQVRSIHRSPGTGLIRAVRADPGFVVLLRKEVIQPHLPVRLPCYDFVPIADPTFDHSLPEGLGHGLRVLPTFMT
jgi:hypothetical protein